MNDLAFRTLTDSLNHQIHHVYFDCLNNGSLKDWLFKAKMLRDDAKYALEECPVTTHTKHMQRAVRSANERICTVQSQLDHVENKKLMMKLTEALCEQGTSRVEISYTSIDTGERQTVTEKASECLHRIETGQITEVASIGYTHLSCYALCLTERSHSLTMTLHKPG